jgi:hypothetical protein
LLTKKIFLNHLNQILLLFSQFWHHMWTFHFIISAHEFRNINNHKKLHFHDLFWQLTSKNGRPHLACSLSPSTRLISRTHLSINLSRLWHSAMIICKHAILTFKWNQSLYFRFSRVLCFDGKYFSPCWWCW